jgi:hypothetical protein
VSSGALVRPKLRQMADVLGRATQQDVGVASLPRP